MEEPIDNPFRLYQNISKAIGQWSWLYRPFTLCDIAFLYSFLRGASTATAFTSRLIPPNLLYIYNIAILHSDIITHLMHTFISTHPFDYQQEEIDDSEERESLVFGFPRFYFLCLLA
jgi:hypothetical protein